MHFYQRINYFTENEWRKVGGKKNPEGSEKGEIKRQLSKTQLKEHRKQSRRKAGG